MAQNRWLQVLNLLPPRNESLGISLYDLSLGNRWIHRDYEGPFRDYLEALLRNSHLTNVAISAPRQPRQAPLVKGLRFTVEGEAHATAWVAGSVVPCGGFRKLGVPLLGAAIILRSMLGSPCLRKLQYIQSLQSFL